ncbi:MAG: hypothetical protein P8R42_05900 [Candidatus Binatia bacterium]|nr:hypothetical protein [Candidatus Binatia bacterium]
MFAKEEVDPPEVSASSRIGRLAARIFAYEPIGRRGVTYLDRWVLARLGERRLYLHRFRFDDPEEPHNHPRTFVSFLFWGSYEEETLLPDGTLVAREMRAPHLRRFPPEHAHRIIRCAGAWSLVAVGRRRQDWGFLQMNEAD